MDPKGRFGGQREGPPLCCGVERQWPWTQMASIQIPRLPLTRSLTQMRSVQIPCLPLNVFKAQFLLKSGDNESILEDCYEE